MLLDLALAPLHGGTGIWDEVISWGVFIIVAAIVGLFFYQQWRERDEEDDLDDEDYDSESFDDDDEDDGETRESGLKRFMRLFVVRDDKAVAVPVVGPVQATPALNEPLSTLEKMVTAVTGDESMAVTINTADDVDTVFGIGVYVINGWSTERLADAAVPVKVDDPTTAVGALVVFVTAPAVALVTFITT